MGIPFPFFAKEIKIQIVHRKKLLNMNMNLYHVHCLTAGRYSLVIYSIGLWRLLNNVIHTFIPITAPKHKKRVDHLSECFIILPIAVMIIHGYR